jgi:hypothetical protein
MPLAANIDDDFNIILFALFMRLSTTQFPKKVQEVLYLKHHLCFINE